MRRRYALFTLVGIAAEDDLDAPDLDETNGQRSTETSSRANGFSVLNKSPVGGHGKRKLFPAPAKQILSDDESARLTTTLLAELKGVSDEDRLSDWAQRSLPLKNTLVLSDASLLERAFKEKLEGLYAFDTPDTVILTESNSADPLTPATKKEDKTVSPISKLQRIRNKEHLKFVAGQPCLVCGKQPSDAHHLRFAQARALGRKVSDEFTVPLCRAHHRELHRNGNEPKWWENIKIDPIAAAERLWRQTRNLPTTAFSATLT